MWQSEWNLGFFFFWVFWIFGKTPVSVLIRFRNITVWFTNSCDAILINHTHQTLEICYRPIQDLFTADLYLFAGKVILTSQSLWPLWDLGRIMLSWRATTCRSALVVGCTTLTGHALSIWTFMCISAHLSFLVKLLWAHWHVFISCIYFCWRVISLLTFKWNYWNCFVKQKWPPKLMHNCAWCQSNCATV